MTFSARSLVDFGLVVLIWLVQLIIYPSFRHYSSAELAGWHPTYTTLITLIVGPLMLAQVGLVGYELYGRLSWLNLLSAVLVGLMWGATAFISVPLHNALAAGHASPALLTRLVDTNWIRTIGWTILFALGLLGTRQATT